MAEGKTQRLWTSDTQRIGRASEWRFVTASGSEGALSVPGLDSARVWAAKRAELDLVPNPSFANVAAV